VSCFWISTFSADDLAPARAASVAARVLPKSHRSCWAVTVAVVLRNRFWVVTERIMEFGTSCPPGFWTEPGTWFQKPFHCPEICGSCGERAMAMFCSCAW
jgi:hypothetical protein